MKTLLYFLGYLWMVTFPVACCVIKLQHELGDEPLPCIDLAKGLIMVTFVALVIAGIYRFVRLLQD